MYFSLSVPELTQNIIIFNSKGFESSWLEQFLRFLLWRTLAVLSIDNLFYRTSCKWGLVWIFFLLVSAGLVGCVHSDKVPFLWRYFKMGLLLTWLITVLYEMVDVTLFQSKANPHPYIYPLFLRRALSWGQHLQKLLSA